MEIKLLVKTKEESDELEKKVTDFVLTYELSGTGNLAIAEERSGEVAIYPGNNSEIRRVRYREGKRESRMGGFVDVNLDTKSTVVEIFRQRYRIEFKKNIT